MEPKFIATIIIIGTFVLLCLIFMIYALYKRSVYRRRQAELTKWYTDENLAKMEYDFAVYDEETERLLEGEAYAADEQVTIEDVLSEDPPSEEVFGKVDGESIEEITGNYKPE